MKVQEKFLDVFHYASSAETWVKGYFKGVGFKCDHTFVQDLCAVDWFEDQEKVKESYNNIVKEWGTDYKTLTEIVMCVNLLSWFNERLEMEGVDDREKWMVFYTELYYESRDKFYNKYGENDEACDWFFQCTD